MGCEKFSVLTSKDVVGHDCQALAVAQCLAQRKQKSRLSAPDRAANADSEGAFGEVTRSKVRQVALGELARMVENLVRMTVLPAVLVRVSVSVPVVVGRAA